MRLRIAVALVLLTITHGLIHTALHALPTQVTAPKQALPGASADPRGARTINALACPACLSHRALLVPSWVAEADCPRWRMAVRGLLLPASFTGLLIPPARAPPLR